MTEMAKTADGFPLVDGMRVWDNNLLRVTVRLNGREWIENGEMWFDTEGENGGLSLSSESRVATRHPGTGEKA